jgi:hypothetical protein
MKEIAFDPEVSIFAEILQKKETLAIKNFI